MAGSKILYNPDNDEECMSDDNNAKNDILDNKENLSNTENKNDLDKNEEPEISDKEFKKLELKKIIADKENELIAQSKFLNEK